MNDIYEILFLAIIVLKIVWNISFLPVRIYFVLAQISVIKDRYYGPYTHKNLLLLISLLLAYSEIYDNIAKFAIEYSKKINK